MVPAFLLKCLPTSISWRTIYLKAGKARALAIVYEYIGSKHQIPVSVECYPTVSFSYSLITTISAHCRQSESLIVTAGAIVQGVTTSPTLCKIGSHKLVQISIPTQ